MLRAVRAVLLKTSGGLLLTSLYYKNARKLGELLEENPALQRQMRELVSRNRDEIKNFIATGTLHLLPDNEGGAVTFLKNLQAAAGPQLKNDIETVLRMMEPKMQRRLLLPGLQ
jgi:hypothetical protein